MSTYQTSCAERIGEELESLESELSALQNNPESDESYDLALSVDTEQITTVCFSWGGPASFLEIKHSGYEISRVTFRFSDWFDTATRDVQEGTATWDYAQLVVDSL